MELRIFSRDLEPLGIVDETISVIWKPSYWDKGDYGDVKILAPITNNNNSLLTKGNIIGMERVQSTAMQPGSGGVLCRSRTDT